MAAITIGAVTFSDPLKWLDKGDPRVIGVDRVTRSGNLVMQRYKSPSQNYLEAKLKFTWCTWSQVATLKSYWLAGGNYSACLEGGSTCTVKFKVEDGVTNVQNQAFGDDAPHHVIQGTAVDKYSGELNLIIISS